MVVTCEGPKPICQEEKVAVVFHHPPKHQHAEEFDSWTLHQFGHVTKEEEKEEEEEGLFSASDCGEWNNDMQPQHYE